MSEELVRRWFEALNARDAEALIAMAHSDIEVYPRTSANRTPISASAPPRGAFSNQLLQKAGFLREGAKPTTRMMRPPKLLNGAKHIHRSRMQVFVTHLMSTMRIGRDPRTSVFDPDGQAHEVRGLFIGDTSALPNGLGGPNPTLTAQALATRTAGRILQLSLG